MTKYRWYSATFGISMAMLTDRMRKRTFLTDPEEDTEGFRVQERKGGILVGQFIERQVWIEHIELPTGEEFEEPRSRVSITHFTISDGPALNLLLTDPPRRISPFLNALDEARSFDGSTSPVVVDVLAWIAAIEGIIGSVKVTYAECGGVQLTPKVLGRYAFRGSDDVRSEALKVIGPQTRATLDSARCEFLWDGNRTILDLSRHGAVKVDPDRTGILPLLAKTIAMTRVEFF